MDQYLQRGGVVATDGGSCTSGDSIEKPAYLSCLSKAQYDAVTASPDVPLQILAGPGSGKTRVLVARVTWLILENHIRPEDLVVVTFTNKAANEMRLRLQKLIGPTRTGALILGTFHATCARYLRKNAKSVDLQNNFSICDADEAKKVIKNLLKSKKASLESRNMPGNLKVEQIMSEISRAKAKDMDPDAYTAHLNQITSNGKGKTNGNGDNGRRVESTEVRRVAAEIYYEYQAYLKENNAVDFDDLLVYGVRLLREEPSVISNVEHVLVDEFQDTNAIQYALMSEMAGRNGSRHSVSVVGDPDQSIYGWRSAEVGNLGLMKQDFGGERVKDGRKSKGVKQVFLEENYRSTGHILKVAKGIIEGDSDRIDRGLYTSHPVGSQVILKRHNSSQHEASFVATEVKRLVAHSGGLLCYDDFAILLRYNALSREVERQLQSENVPSRMLGGARFFERKEVKDILAYLTLADNPYFTPALERVINVPKRAIGDKALADLKAMADEQGVRTMEIVEKAAKASGSITGIKAGVQKSLRGFFEVIKEIRQMAVKHVPVSSIIETVIKRIKYEDFLKKEDDYAQRWENVKELMNFSTIVAQAGVAIPFEPFKPVDSDDEEEVEDDGMDYEAEGPDVSWESAPTAYLKDDSLDSADVKKEETDASMPVKKKGSAKRKAIEIIDLSSSGDEDVKSVVSNEKKGKKTNNKSVSGKESEKNGSKGRTSRSGSKTISSRSGSKKPRSTSREEEEEEQSDTSATLVESEVADDGDSKSPLRVFLEASTLSTDMEQDGQDGKSPKVTIATTHAAKGLEFPVVFVLGVENGIFPFFRCTSPEEINEECRLLYVAATRAQTHLYLNYTAFRMSNGETREQTLSSFVARIADAGKIKGGQWRATGTGNGMAPGGFVGYGSAVSSSVAAKMKTPDKIDFITRRPKINESDRKDMAKVLDRPIPDEKVAADLIDKFDNSNAGARSAATDAAIENVDEMRNSGFFNMQRLGQSAAITTSTSANISNGGFTSARSLVGPKLTPVGASITSKTFDKDGWATGTTRAAPRQYTGPSMNLGANRLRHTSSFMDEYRLSKNHLAHEGMTMDKLLGITPAKAYVKSRQSKNNDAIKGFMNMLPADDNKSSVNTNGGGSSLTSSRVGQNQSNNDSKKQQPKRRLGMGRPRPL